MKEQLAIRAPILTRSMKSSGALGAYSLGDLQGPSPTLSARLCRKHRWRVAKWSRRCGRCGLVEDRAG